jgi:hypothetical protein
MRALIVASVLLLAGGTASAQIIPERQPTQQQQPQPEDTVKVPQFRRQPPVSPVGAMWRSLLVPGWGQSILGRRVTGAFFIVFEGISVTMIVKSANQLDYFERIDDGSDFMAEKIDGKEQELEDWIFLLIFNHLISAAEAFVSGVLWDFPADLDVGASPDGGVHAGVSLEF